MTTITYYIGLNTAQGVSEEEDDDGIPKEGNVVPFNRLASWEELSEDEYFTEMSPEEIYSQGDIYPPEEYENFQKPEVEEKEIKDDLVEPSSSESQPENKTHLSWDGYSTLSEKDLLLVDQIAEKLTVEKERLDYEKKDLARGGNKNIRLSPANRSRQGYDRNLERKRNRGYYKQTIGLNLAINRGAKLSIQLDPNSIINDPNRKLYLPQYIESRTKGEAKKAIESAVAILEERGPLLLPTNKVLFGIYKKNSQAALGGYSAMNSDLYSLLGDPRILILAYNKLKSNKGSTTPGPDGISADGFSLERVIELSRQIKKGEFRWSPFTRKFINKEGAKPDPITKKLPQRPLGIPNFKDRLVQEAIRYILHAIYDPYFEMMDCAFGFRPFKGCHDALDNIFRTGKSMDYAIEGDIKGAFNNVVPAVMIEILNKKINDKKFLNLINDGFHCGLYEQGIYKDTLLGTPQGGIASPILFNIYLMELDEYVDNIRKEYANQNTYQNQGVTELKELNKELKTMRQRISRFNATQKANNPSRRNLLHDQAVLAYEAEERIPQILKRKEELTNTSLPSQIRISYTRFADDWIILTNASKVECEKIKENIRQFLDNRLGLELSQEKTKITDITTNRALFLGYSIFRKASTRMAKLSITHKSAISFLKYNPPINEEEDPYPSDFLKQGPNSKTKRIKKRVISLPTIGIDMARVLKRFTIKRFCTASGKPREAPHLAALPPHEIVEAYNQVIMGMFNYYYSKCTYKSGLNRLCYILYFSCLKTLAMRKRVSIKKFITNNSFLDITTFGKQKSYPLYNRRVVIDYVMDNKNKRIVLLNYREACARMEAILINQAIMAESVVQSNTVDFTTAYKRYWRTTFKLATCCVICGMTPRDGAKIQNHHIRHVKKSNKSKGFARLMGILNRKQIPLCQYCHNQVHNGSYDRVALSDLHTGLDLIAISESQIVDNATPTSKEARFTTNIRNNRIIYPGSNAYQFNFENKTIYSKYIAVGMYLQKYCPYENISQSEAISRAIKARHQMNRHNVERLEK